MYKLLSEIFNSIWLIDPIKANGYLPLIEAIITGKNINDQNFSKERESSRPYFLSMNSESVYEVSEYGIADPPEKAPENSICVIPLYGAITKFDQFCGPAGTKTKMDILQRAESNDNIKAIIIRIDGPGGEGAGTQSFANAIQKCSKPVIGFVEDIAASADYWIASACNLIMAENSSSEVGSIGAYCTIADFTEWYAEKGIKLIDVYAKQSTDKNKDYKEALKGNTELLQKSVSEFTEFFINDVKKFRGDKINLSEANPYTGKMFFAEDAIKIGLVDEIGTFDIAVQRAVELSRDTSENDDDNNFSTKNNTDMKFTFKNTWTAIAKFFGYENTDGKELTEEDVDMLNTELERVTNERDQFETDLKTEKKTSEDLQARVTELEEKITKMPGKETSKIDKEKDSDESDDGVDWDAINNLAHNKEADQNLI